MISIKLLIIGLLLMFSTSIMAQANQSPLMKVDSLLSEIDPIKIYIVTRYKKEWVSFDYSIKTDSLFCFIDGQPVSFGERDISEIYFYQPHPFFKWIGMASGAILANTVIYFLDNKFPWESYAIASLFGGASGYMLGRGIGAERLSVKF